MGKDTGKAICKYCGLNILWSKPEAWKDPHPLEPRKLTIFNDKTGAWVSGHESHFAYCEKANEARSKK